MIKLTTDNGKIRISSDVFTMITGIEAVKCYGVKGMAMRSMSDGLVHLLRREAMSKGVYVTYNEDDSVSIELHIIVDYGVNLATMGKAIIDQVSYRVEKETGIAVKTVDVCIDSMAIG